MQYLLLIYQDEKKLAAFSPEEGEAHKDAYRTFTESIVKSGHFKGGDALLPVATAKSVRRRSGETVATDGPFAETKEQLGGYYLIEAEDDAEAVAIAARIPAAEHGTVEVRPVMIY